MASETLRAHTIAQSNRDLCDDAQDLENTDCACINIPDLLE